MLTRSQQTRSSRFAALAAFVGSAVLATGASAGIFGNAWNVGGAAPIVSGTSVEFVVAQEAVAPWANGQFGSKDFYSTSGWNGRTMASLIGGSLSYTITAPTTLVSPGGTGSNTGLEGPYVNIVVTDGTGGYAYLLPDASPAPLGQQFHDFDTAQWNFNEVFGSMAAFVTGLGAPDSVHDGRNWFDFSDIASLTIANAGLSSNPGGIAPAGGWTGFGLTDSVLFVSGNRGSSPTPDVTIDGVVAVPEPATLALLGLGLAGLGFSRRKK